MKTTLGIFISALFLILAGCAGEKSEVHFQDPLEEVAYLMFSKELKGSDGEWLLFLAKENPDNHQWEAVSDDLLWALKKFHKNIRGIESMNFTETQRCVDKDTGEIGTVMSIRPHGVVGKNKVKISVEFYSAPLAGSGTVYIATKGLGGWTFERVSHWISQATPESTTNRWSQFLSRSALQS